MRIHIENDPDGAPSLRLSADRLEAALAGSGAALEITENSTPARMADAVQGAEILFSCRKIDIAAAKAASKGLRWVQVISAGVEAYLAHLPPDVVLTNASGVHAAKGAEFVLTAALMLNFRIPAFATQQQAQIWAPTFGGPLAGKRITLLGVGGIGSACAPLLRERGAIVTGVTRSGRSDVRLDACIGLDGLDAVLPTTDILVSTLPATTSTRGLIDRRRIALLRPSAGIVSVGRAAVIDYDAMAEALAAGRLDGAVLDVFPEEPLPQGHVLWSCPRLVMTPHCSVDDHDGYLDRCIAIFERNLRAWCQGEALINVVDPDRGY